MEAGRKGRAQEGDADSDADLDVIFSPCNWRHMTTSLDRRPPHSPPPLMRSPAVDRRGPQEPFHGPGALAAAFGDGLCVDQASPGRGRGDTTMCFGIVTFQRGVTGVFMSTPRFLLLLLFSTI